jgi:hypothetical protein
MGYAPHTNTDVVTNRNLAMVLGCFNEKDYGCHFEYAIRPVDGVEFAEDCPHIIYVQDGYRYAKVLKTVAWVVIGEHEDGSPIYDKWNIKQHRVYPTEWVHEKRREYGI